MMQASSSARPPRGAAGGCAEALQLRLSVVNAPGAPPGLRGAAGAVLDRGCCASALAAAGGARILHVSEGTLFETPPIQHVRLMLHAATGLEQLHLEPEAAAAAAAAAEKSVGGGGGGVGPSSSPADGGRLLDIGKTWLQERSKGTRLEGVVAWAGRARDKVGGGERTGAAAAGPLAGDASPLAVSPAPSPVPTPLATADVEGPTEPASEATGEAEDTEDFAEAGTALGSSDGGASCGGGAAAALQSEAPGAAADEGSPRAAPAEVVSRGSPPPWLLPGAGAGLQQQQLGGKSPGQQHKRLSSVEREVLMGLLEDNGFHHSDGAFTFFYVRISCAAANDGVPAAAAAALSTATPPGAGVTSRMVPLCGMNAAAVWEQPFWFALPRPADASVKVEFEVMASTDKKLRGKSVAKLEVPLYQLLDPSKQVSGEGAGAGAARRFVSGRGAAGGGEAEAPAWEHELRGRLRDFLPFTLFVSVQAADADSRVTPAGVPRALAPPPPPPGRQSDTARRSADISSADGTPSPARLAPATSAGAPAAGAQAATAPPGGGAASAAVAAAAAAVAPLVSRLTGVGPDGEGPVAALGAPYSSPSVVGALEVVVNGVELAKPTDCFFVLQMGPYWAVSTTTHSTMHPTWHWHLRLPVSDPAAVLTLALFRRDDQSGGKRVVSVRTVFGDGTRMVGKLRVRASTLAPNVPVNVKLPLQGERTNLRGGRACAATADLFLLLRVPSLPAWLTSYGRVPIPRSLYLAAAAGDPPLPLETLSAAERRAAARWLVERLPHGRDLPVRALTRVQDDGRAEFTLSRARHNWRRLMAARAWGEGTLGEAFVHICKWSNPWHSGGVVAVVLLLGAYPSQVLSVLLLLLSALLWRGSRGDGPERPPPMEADIALPEEDGGDGGIVVPADPYSALKQNYEAVVAFTTTVQNVLDDWASSFERLQSLATWRDPTASWVLLAYLLSMSAALSVLGLRTLVTITLLWVFRPPALRDPCPPPPNNFVQRLPTRGDTTL